MTIRELIKCLKEKEADVGAEELELIVCTSKGMIIAMSVEGQAKAISDALKLFSK